jgi:tRNA acetyltransferase TAN1
LLKDFNLLATTSRGTERQMCHELSYLLHDLLGDPSPVVDKSGIRGLVVAKTSLNPVEVIEKFRAVLQERPYEFRYALRILPIERVVPTDLDEIKRVAMELAEGIGENESFRVTVEKRFTSLHSRDFIEAAAADIARKADLETPDKILLIEVLGGVTGMSFIKPDAVLAVVKEKLL